MDLVWLAGGMVRVIALTVPEILSCGQSSPHLSRLSTTALLVASISSGFYIWKVADVLPLGLFLSRIIERTQKNRQRQA